MNFYNKIRVRIALKNFRIGRKYAVFCNPNHRLKEILLQEEEDNCLIFSIFLYI